MPAHRLVEQRAGGHQVEDLVRDRPVGAELRAAGRAAPQMELECVRRSVGALAIGHLRKRLRELVAAAAVLDLSEDLQESLPALGHTPVDLRIRPARDLAYLGVRVPLRLESQRPDLLRLQGVECLSAADHSLAPGQSVVGTWALRGDRVERVPLVVLVGAREPWGAEETLPLTTHRQGLALGDRLHPADERVALDRRRLRQQNLEGPLIRVLGVVGADRIAPRCPPEDGVVSFDQGAGCATARLGGGDCLSGLIYGSSFGPRSTGCSSQLTQTAHLRHIRVSRNLPLLAPFGQRLRAQFA